MMFSSLPCVLVPAYVVLVCLLVCLIGAPYLRRGIELVGMCS